jgi:hypothetical protein
VERGEQKKAAAGGSREDKGDGLARQLDVLEKADPATTRVMVEMLLGRGADLDSPYAHFVASKWQGLLGQPAADAGIALDVAPYALDGTTLSAMRGMLDGEWSNLSDAEKAAFTSPPSFAAAARVGVTTDEASSSSTAPAAADGKRDAAVVGAAASTSAAAGRAPLELKPNEGTAYGTKLHSSVNSYVLGVAEDMLSWFRSEYGGDFRRLRADADRGDAKAQLAMSFFPAEQGGYAADALEWVHKSAERRYGDAVLALAMRSVATGAAVSFTEAQIATPSHSQDPPPLSTSWASSNARDRVPRLPRMISSRQCGGSARLRIRGSRRRSGSSARCFARVSSATCTCSKPASTSSAPPGRATPKRCSA